MTEKDRKLAIQIIEILVEATKDKHPQEFKAFFMGGIVTNLFGSMSDRYWQEFIKPEPCGQPMCNCHLLAAQVAPALEAMRQDYIDHAPKPGFSE